MKNENRKKSDAQEKRWAAAIDGEVVRGSGSGWRHKSDVKNRKWLFELKRTDGKSLGLKEDDWEKLVQEAAMEDLVPAMHLELGKRGFVLLSEVDFLLLVEEDESS